MTLMAARLFFQISKSVAKASSAPACAARCVAMSSAEGGAFLPSITTACQALVTPSSTGVLAISSTISTPPKVCFDSSRPGPVYQVTVSRCAL